MRLVLACLTVLSLALGSSVVATSVLAADDYTMQAEQQQPQQPQPPPSGEIDVDITTTTTDADWWANPVWIGIGAVALLLIVVLIVMASRGGTTVVKE
jgi:hypothetical protein